MLRTAAAAAGLMLIGGCGLGDYEGQLQRTQERLALLDDNLAGEVQLPASWPAIVFRPPKGIAIQPKEAGGWLLRLPPEDKVVPAPRELFIAHLRKPVHGKVDERVRDYLKALSGGSWSARAEARSEEIAPPWLDSASHPEGAVKYRRWSFRSEEKLPGEAGAPPLLWDYDLYVHEAEGLTVIIIFKQVNWKETEEKWKGHSPLPLGRLFATDWARFDRQRRLSLSTLRVPDR